MRANSLKLRRDVSARWEEINPVLDSGEPGFEKDTGRLKIGDGVSQWMDLEYFVPLDPEGGGSSLPEHIESETPHPVYDDGPSLNLLYENAKV